MLKAPFRFFAALLVSLLLINTLAVRAQDASQVLRLSVGFRTLKNSTTLPEEKRKEVEQLEAQARQASNDQKYGDALRHYHHAMTLLRGQTWTPARAFGLALQLKAERLVLDPGETVRLKLTQQFALTEPLTSKLTGTLTLAQPGQTATAKELQTLSDLEPDFTTSPLALAAKLPDVADGDYQLTLTLKPAAGEPIVKTAAVRIAKGLNAEAAALKKRAATVAAQLKAEKKDALLLALPPVEYAASLIELVNDGQLVLERPLGPAGATERLDIKASLTRAASLLDQIAAGKHPLAATRGDIHWAYRSAVDDTLQPYRLFVPANYDAAKRWPLVVALHGMGGDENSFFTNYANGVIKQEAEQRGYLVVCPKGRGAASMYMGAAERDVIDVLREVKREYAIDDDRVYLMGHSMGGYGSWSVAVNHPALFAAIAPIAGGGTPFTVAKLKEITHIPWLVVHGDKDPTVPVEESRKMVKAGKDLGIEIKYVEVPGGNHSNIVVPAFKDIFTWFDAHKRQPRAAAKAAGSGQ